MPTQSTFRIGGAFASAISCWRINSSMNVSPRPPYFLGQVRPIKPASKSACCQRRRSSYCSARGISELPMGFHSRGMFVLSQARTVAPKASCSGVSERSISPPEGGRAERLNSGSFSDPSRVKSRLILRPTVISISLPRLTSRINTLARFGGLPGGGVTRMYWSPPHEEARAWLLGEMRAAGLETWVDPAGNTFGATGIRALLPETPAIVTGSHIDTVPEGGILDGALGVLAGLEYIQTITETRTRHARPLVVAAWSDEEGRYGSLFGSRAFCGMLEDARIDEMAAVDGVRLVDAMARAGFDAHRAPEARVPARAVDAYVELHIEQGARLEEAGIPIGIVETIVGVRRSRVVFKGQADHAGTTPMDRRRDAFLASADYALHVREHVVARGSKASVTNFGVVHVHPGASNIVPGRAELVHEMRDPDVAVLERLAT